MGIEHVDPNRELAGKIYSYIKERGYYEWTVDARINGYSVEVAVWTKTYSHGEDLSVIALVETYLRTYTSYSYNVRIGRL